MDACQAPAPITGLARAFHRPTMSTREIAQLCEKEHRNVMRDARAMLIELYDEDRLLSFEQTVFRPNPSGGAPIESRAYALPKRETLILVSGYSLKLRTRIIDRWQELEDLAASAPAVDAIQALGDPAALRGLLLTYSEKVLALQAEKKELEAENQGLFGRAMALDRIAEARGSLAITDAAKVLGIRPKQLFAYLRTHHWIYTRPGQKSDHAYQSKLIDGLLEHKVTRFEKIDGPEILTVQVRVTPKGLAVLAEECPPIFVAVAKT